mgnify:FL=1
MQRTGVDWSFINVPQGISITQIGRQIVTRNSMKRLDKFDLRQLAYKIEQFIRSP